MNKPSPTLTVSFDGRPSYSFTITDPNVAMCSVIEREDPFQTNPRNCKAGEQILALELSDRMDGLIQFEIPSDWRDESENDAIRARWGHD